MGYSETSTDGRLVRRPASYLEEMVPAGRGPAPPRSRRGARGGRARARRAPWREAAHGAPRRARPLRATARPRPGRALLDGVDLTASQLGGASFATPGSWVEAGRTPTPMRPHAPRRAGRRADDGRGAGELGARGRDITGCRLDLANPLREARARALRVVRDGRDRPPERGLRACRARRLDLRRPAGRGGACRMHRPPLPPGGARESRTAGRRQIPSRTRSMPSRRSPRPPESTFSPRRATESTMWV